MKQNTSPENIKNIKNAKNIEENAVKLQGILENIFQKIQRKLSLKLGKVASYIPELATINPEQFGMAIVTVDQQIYGVGDYLKAFSIQSISKTFALSLAMSLQGEDIWKRIRREPSGNAFNSMVQLEYEKGMPRNPFINSGAITITDILCSEFKHPENALLKFVQKLADDHSIRFNMNVARSEFNTAYRNLSIAFLLKSFGNMENQPLDVVRTYCTHCSLELSCLQLAKAGLFLANHGLWMPDVERQMQQQIQEEEKIPNPTQEKLLTADAVKRINAIMTTCGAYDAAGDLAYRIGWPLKTGVGGGILAIVPNMMSIAVWSPALDEVGNSLLAVEALEMLSQETQISVF